MDSVRPEQPARCAALTDGCEGDFRCAPTAQTIEAVNSLGLARDDLDALCSGNAERIMNISA